MANFRSADPNILGLNPSHIKLEVDLNDLKFVLSVSCDNTSIFGVHF